MQHIMRTIAFVSIILVVSLSFSGCKNRDSDEYGFLGQFFEPPDDTSPDGIYNITSDANRNGTVQTDGSDDVGEGNWNTVSGAVMLYNNDDDDSDTERDHVNTSVDGTADASDLAKLIVRQIPGIESGSYAQISIDADSSGYVRLFKYNGSWSLFDHTSATISDAELAAGNVIFGIESLHYAETASGAAGLWSGKTDFTLTVKDSGNIVLGTDKVQMRTAPFMLPNHLCPVERLYICNTGTNASYVSDMVSVASTLGVPLTQISTVDPWTQDQFEFGFVETPSGNHPVVLNSPRNNGSGFINYAWNNLLGPDFGCVQYGTDGTESLNSFGNLECIPPHGNYPLGRIIVGGAGSRRMEQSIRDFLSAQSIQGPVYELDTTWLVVGHVDEILSFIPAPNARGWVVAYADPDTAIEILQGLPGATPVFEGTGSDTTVSAILNDVDLMDLNDQVQAILDTLRSTLKADFGLTDADFIEIPVLWEALYVPPWRAVAYSPGAVNWIVVNGDIIIAKQYGPEQTGVDKFEENITSKLAALGITAYYVDDWTPYHVGLGEIHCGSNTIRTMPASPKWWNTGK